MFVELHILQNFSPSNLNRDDTGAPKDCEFGGVRRARVSSQCLKRAIRTEFRVRGLVPETGLATRTKRLRDALVLRFAKAGKEEADATTVADRAVGAMKLNLKAEGKTEYLLFLAEREIDALAERCVAAWDALAAAPAQADAPKGKAKKGGDAGLAEIAKSLRDALDGGRAIDLALFGRMLADLPDRNVVAATQVAHALSVNKVNVDFDYYTAVDDLKPDDASGADMIGTVELTSACFYRYMNVDVGQLARNLQGDLALARDAVDAFIEAAVRAVPSGKQSGTAAQNPPSLVLAVVREHGLWSLANAFETPVRPERDQGLVVGAARRLDAYWRDLQAMYGTDGITGVWVCALGDVPLDALAERRVAGVGDVQSKVAEALAAWTPAMAKSNGAGPASTLVAHGAPA